MRVSFLVDGFNLYHSLCDAEQVLGTCVKWLNLYSLCSFYLPYIHREAKLESIYYFSALALHKDHYDPGKITRHRTYIDCLKDQSIYAELGRFKAKQVKCHRCQNEFTKYEEKETDVSIAVTLMELVFSNSLDVAVLLTGDTDLIPAIRKVNTMFPNKQIISLMPYRRKNKELMGVAWKSFYVKPDRYKDHQLPAPYRKADGSEILKPTSW